MIGYTSNKLRRKGHRLIASPSSFFHQRQQRRRQRTAATTTLIPTVEQIADHENLLTVFHEMKRNAGQAPGPDRITYSHLGASEAAEILRAVSRSLAAGTYRPGPARSVPIPKPGGGRRTLTIRGVIDRVVSKALHEAMLPYWETVFLPRSMGFRPGRSAWHLLAELEAVMVKEDLWVLTVDDVRKAFDNVVIADVMDDHRLHVKDVRLLALIESVLRGDDPRKEVGIDQGGAYSPTALNVRLHHAHDLAVMRGHHPPSWRYADNHAYLTRTAAEGRQVHDHARELLNKAGLHFKGPTSTGSTDGSPVDLHQGGKVQLLGFTLSKRDDRLYFDLGDGAWEKLDKDLTQAHEAEDPNETASMVISGWINAYGPAFESERDDVSDRTLRTAAQHGFREICSLDDVIRQRESSWKRWLALKGEAHRNHGDVSRERGTAAAPPAPVDPGG